MRDIKFKGKTYTGEWVGGYLCTKGDEVLITNYDVIPETVCQYTGLHDKNDVPIYEGDIVRCSGEYLFTVKFGKCGGINNDENYGYMGFYLEPYDRETKRSKELGLRDDICYFTDIEIWGNIHNEVTNLKKLETVVKNAFPQCHNLKLLCPRYFKQIKCEGDCMKCKEKFWGSPYKK